MEQNTKVEQVAEKVEKISKKRKQVEDPGFNVWVNINKHLIDDSIESAEMAKILLQKWDQLTVESKEYCQNLANAEKFKTTCTKAIKPNKKVKKEHEVKGPTNAFWCWLADGNRERIKNSRVPPIADVTEVTKKAGEEWKLVADKSKWIKMEADDKIRYKQEMEQLNSK
jgi:hypothetical protein